VRASPSTGGESEKAMKKIFLPVGMLALLMSALLMLAGCTSEPTKPAEKPQPKPPDFLTGRGAFQPLYVDARGWARDAQPFQLQSQTTSDANGRDGKADVWRAVFASPSQRASKPYMWVGTDALEGVSRGISPGPEDSYNPSNASTQVFDIAYLKIDSDQALQVAQKHGGDKLLEKNPDLPVIYLLDWSRPENSLIWHVIYGANRGDAKLTVDVNASSGEFVRVEK
jgi:hypothetical protein